MMMMMMMMMVMMMMMMMMVVMMMMMMNGGTDQLREVQLFPCMTSPHVETSLRRKRRNNKYINK